MNRAQIELKETATKTNNDTESVTGYDRRDFILEEVSSTGMS